MNKKLSVIQLIDSLNPGGAEMMAVNIANELTDNGINSYLCATRLEGNLKKQLKKDVDYIFLNKKYTIEFKAIFKLSDYIKNKNITIIHAHSSSYFLAILVKLINPKIKVIWHSHYGNSLNLAYYKVLILKVCSLFFTQIIVVNNTLKNWVKDYLKFQNVLLIPNFPIFNELQKTYLKGVKGKRIVCIANFRPDKDHLNLLKSFEVVVKNYPSWTLHIVGMDFTDDYSEKIISFISEHKLSNYVFLYGSCQDIKFILDQSTIGVLSSKSEGLPVSLLEYGLAKLPVVVTNVGDCASVVEDGKSGIIVPVNNDKDLSEGMIELIEDETKRKLFGISLNKIINQDYSQNNIIKLINIYKKC